MKKSKILILCTLLTMSTAFATACGDNGNNNGTEAPYQDETNNDVNGSTNDGGNLKDAGRNLMDSVEDAGGAIMNGVRDLTGTNGNNINNNTTNNGR